jgi:hypothetical protein
MTAGLLLPAREAIKLAPHEDAIKEGIFEELRNALLVRLPGCSDSLLVRWPEYHPQLLHRCSSVSKEGLLDEN